MRPFETRDRADPHNVGSRGAVGLESVLGGLATRRAAVWCKLMLPPAAGCLVAVKVLIGEEVKACCLTAATVGGQAEAS